MANVAQEGSPGGWGASRGSGTGDSTPPIVTTVQEGTYTDSAGRPISREEAIRTGRISGPGATGEALKRIGVTSGYTEAKPAGSIEAAKQSEKSFIESRLRGPEPGQVGYHATPSNPAGLGYTTISQDRQGFTYQRNIQEAQYVPSFAYKPLHPEIPSLYGREMPPSIGLNLGYHPAQRGSIAEAYAFEQKRREFITYKPTMRLMSISERLQTGFERRIGYGPESSIQVKALSGFGGIFTGTPAFIGQTAFVGEAFIRKPTETVTKAIPRGFGIFSKQMYEQATTKPAEFAGSLAGMAVISKLPSFAERIPRPTYRQMFGGVGPSPFEGVSLKPKLPTYREMFGGVGESPVKALRESFKLPTRSEIFGYKKVEIIPKKTSPIENILILQYRPREYSTPSAERIKAALEKGSTGFSERGVMGMQFGSKGYKPSSVQPMKSGLLLEREGILPDMPKSTYKPIKYTEAPRKPLGFDILGRPITEYQAPAIRESIIPETQKAPSESYYTRKLGTMTIGEQMTMVKERIVKTPDYTKALRTEKKPIVLPGLKELSEARKPIVPTPKKGLFVFPTIKFKMPGTKGYKPTFTPGKAPSITSRKGKEQQIFKAPLMAFGISTFKGPAPTISTISQIQPIIRPDIRIEPRTELRQQFQARTATEQLIKLETKEYRKIDTSQLFPFARKKRKGKQRTRPFLEISPIRSLRDMFNSSFMRPRKAAKRKTKRNKRR